MLTQLINELFYNHHWINNFTFKYEVKELTKEGYIKTIPLKLHSINNIRARSLFGVSDDMKCSFVENNIKQEAFQEVEAKVNSLVKKLTKEEISNFKLYYHFGIVLRPERNQ